jgi:hypothetical protein
MYAFQGYAEVMLADLFCSGVPLSTLDFQEDFTYHASSTTQQVYEDAIAKFDTAFALSSDSVDIQNLARIGKGRAYLALGRYADAAKAVDSVPDGFQYQLAVPWGTASNISTYNLLNSYATVSDGEGRTGLPFISSDDPRTRDTATYLYQSASIRSQLYFPLKYASALSNGSGTSRVTLADWIEGRLIRAEAALQAGDPATWLMELNTLRRTAMVSGMTMPLPDTLTDPGDSPADSARIALLFSERAYWLYLTGHRQGDLRRLVRQYGWDQADIYPIGDYFANGLGVYGNDVTVPIPSSSEKPNPLFHGCLNRDA